MLIGLLWAALRRRPFSVLSTALLGVIWAALLRVPAPAAVLAWALVSLLLLEVWIGLESVLLERMGCLRPAPRDEERIAKLACRFDVSVRVQDDVAPWVASAPRTVVVSRGALEQFDDVQLSGLVAQAARSRHAPIRLREAVVWLGNAPLLLGLLASGFLTRLGRLLAQVLGAALIFPMVLWPGTFVDVAGRFIGAVLIGLIGAVLVSSGQAALGVALWSAWALVPGLRALLAWEARELEADVDRAVVSLGFGAQLLGSLEWLAILDTPGPSGTLRWFVRASVPDRRRLKRLSSLVRGQPS
jgi:hypothetical protein